MQRILTTEAEKQIRHFYKRIMPFGVWVIIALCVGTWLPIILSLLFQINALLLIVPYVILIFGIDQYFFRRKINRAKEVYQYGDEVTIELESAMQNWGTKVNGAPQRIIAIRKGNEVVNIKTFSPRVVEAFSAPVQRAYVLQKYPNVILPETIFSNYFYNPNATPDTRQKRSINI